MALSIASSPQFITGTQGQYLKSCCQVTSTDSLVGEVICVNPALFANSSTQLPINNTNQYKRVFPTFGTEEMDYVGSSPTNENHRVTIEYIDDKNFIICIEFFVLNDIGGYISDVGQNNFTALNTITPGLKFLNLFIEAGSQQSVVCYQHLEVNSFCLEEVIFSTPFLGGYCVGQDLDITIKIPVSLGISNNLFAGFVQHNSVSNVLSFAKDYKLSYVEIGNGVSNVDNLGNDCIKDGLGFLSDGIESTATVKIDGACLITGGKYCLYVIYKNQGEWQSCISEPICQAFNKPLPDINADIFSCELTDNLGVIHTDCCVSGIAPCGKMHYCVELNETILQASLVAAGYTGTVEDYFQNAVLSVGGETTTLNVYVSPLRLCVILNIDNAQGILNVIADFNFNFDGFAQTIRLQTELTLDGSIEEVNPVIELDGQEVDEVICCGTEGTLGFSVDGDCQYFLSKNFAAFSPIGETIQLSELDCETVNCVKALCQGDITQTVDCECPPCEDVSIRIQISSENCVGFPSPNCDGNLSAQVLTGNVVSMLLTQITSGQTSTGVGNAASIDFSFNSSFYQVSYQFEFTLDNGCSYVTTGMEIIANDIIEPTGETFIEINEILNGIGLQDCDLSGCEECDKINTASVEFECDENGISSYNIITNYQSTGSIDNQTIEELDDDGNLVKVYVNQTFTPDDGCPPVTVEQVIDCLPISFCLNDRTVDSQVSVDCTELTLTLIDSFDSPILGDKFYIKINGDTTEYDLFNGDTIPSPISVSDGDVICWWSNTIFGDSCVDFNLPQETIVISCDLECDYSAYQPTCSFDDETCEFSADFPDGTGLEIDEQKFCLAGGKEILYTKPVIGTGLFTVIRYVKLPNCDPEELTDYCSVKSGINIKLPDDPIQVEGCITVVEPRDVVVCCTGMSISCDQESCTLMATLDCPPLMEDEDPCNGDEVLAEYTIEWFKEGVSVGTGETHGPLTEDCDLEIIATPTTDDCPPIVVNYPYEHIKTNPTVEDA